MWLFRYRPVAKIPHKLAYLIVDKLQKLAHLNVDPRRFLPKYSQG